MNHLFVHCEVLQVLVFNITHLLTHRWLQVLLCIITWVVLSFKLIYIVLPAFSLGFLHVFACSFKGFQFMIVGSLLNLCISAFHGQIAI